MSLASDNALISGVGARSDVTSQTSKTAVAKSAVLPSQGLLRPVELITTSATAQARTLHNSDSGKLFNVNMAAAGVYTVTVGAGVAPGAVFDFVVSAIAGGAGNFVLNAGTGRTIQGTRNMNGGVVSAVTNDAHTNFRILAAAVTVGASVRVTVVSSTKVQFEGLAVAAAVFDNTA